jgi:hypothetical protein
MIKFLLEKGYINSAQWRTIELFIINSWLALWILILDNIDIIINWWNVNWSLSLWTFFLWLVSAVTAWVRKGMRDKIEEFTK